MKSKKIILINIAIIFVMLVSTFAPMASAAENDPSTLSEIQVMSGPEKYGVKAEEVTLDEDDAQGVDGINVTLTLNDETITKVLNEKPGNQSARGKSIYS